MIFQLIFFNEKTALFIAIERDDYEMAQLLLTNNNIDVNIICIFKRIF